MFFPAKQNLFLERDHDKMRKNGGIFKNKMEEDIEMKIYHAQVNHLENPMGFRMERTVFSWKVKDAEGKKQSYARIRVASDAAMEHLLFDSGEDDKASSLFYPVKLDLERERGITGTWKRAVMPGRRR